MGLTSAGGLGGLGSVPRLLSEPSSPHRSPQPADRLSGAAPNRNNGSGRAKSAYRGISTALKTKGLRARTKEIDAQGSPFLAPSRLKRIQQISREILQIQQGSLYPALYRLERKRLISAEWGASDNNRRAKYYSITKAGRQQLEKEQAQWERLSSAVALILQRA